MERNRCCCRSAWMYKSYCILFTRMWPMAPNITQQSIGRACCCWLCGHVGIPSNIEKCAKGLRVAGRCAKCGSDEQTNFVKLEQKGSTIPWIQLKVHAPVEAVQAAAKAEGVSCCWNPKCPLLQSEVQYNSQLQSKKGSADVQTWRNTHKTDTCMHAYTHTYIHLRAQCKNEYMVTHLIASPHCW